MVDCIREQFKTIYFQTDAPRDIMYFFLQRIQYNIRNNLIKTRKLNTRRVENKFLPRLVTLLKFELNRRKSTAAVASYI